MATQATIEFAQEQHSLKGVRVATVAWLLTSVYYFFQYALRSAPGVMMPQLSDAFGLSALGVASIVGLFYYGYSPVSHAAAAGQTQAASVGRVLQGAGGFFPLIGAIYIATKSFPASKAATLIGATQMF